MDNEQKIQSFSLYMDMAPLVIAMDGDTAARWIWAVFRFIDGVDTDTISDDAFVNAFWEQTKIKLQISIDKAIKRSADAKNAVTKREEKRNERYQRITNDNERYQRITNVPTIQDINSNSTVLKQDSTGTVTVLQEGESGAAHPADAGAAASPFTFADVKECAEEYDIDLSRRQLENFYAWMEKYNWTINGRKVSKLENALSGYAKKHRPKRRDQEEYEDEEETAAPEPIKRPPVRKEPKRSLVEWLRIARDQAPDQDKDIKLVKHDLYLLMTEDPQIPAYALMAYNAFTDYFPVTEKIYNLPEDYIDEIVIPNWQKIRPQLLEAIESM